MTARSRIEPLLLEGGVVLTLDGDAHVLEADVLIEHGRIAGIGSQIEAAPATRRLRLDGDLVLPGFVQGHVHLGQTLFRGLGEERRLLRWLSERIWPLEATHDDDSAYWSAMLGAAECLLAGTTTIQEIGIGPGFAGVEAAIRESGLRAYLGPCLMDGGDQLPARLAGDTDAVLAGAEALGRRLARDQDDRLRFCLNPRFILSCSHELWLGIVELARRHAWPVHTHALEQKEEGEAVVARLGCDEIDYFERIGLLDCDLRIAHGVQLEPAHLERLDGDRFAVCHCPGSNLKLSSGIADLQAIRRAGIPLSIGADGAACNNDLDPLEEVRLAALLQKLTHGAGAMSGLEALRLLTSEGAAALRWRDEIGVVAEGMRADLVVLDSSRPELWPLPTPSWRRRVQGPTPDLHDSVAFAASRAAVKHVLIEGALEVEDGRLARLDLDTIRRHARPALERCLEAADLR